MYETVRPMTEEESQTLVFPEGVKFGCRLTRKDAPHVTFDFDKGNGYSQWFDSYDEAVAECQTVSESGRQSFDVSVVVVENPGVNL